MTLTPPAQTDGQSLSQEEIDSTVSHLIETEITNVAVARALKRLDDIESGSGELPPDWRPYCKKCNEQLEDNEMVGIAFGNFYHDACVPSLSTGPLPLGQLLAGTTDKL